MFGLKRHVVDVPSIKRVGLRLVPADDSFMGDSHEQVEVRGFDVNTADGRVLRLSDAGPVADGVFHFRLADGVAHPRSGEFDTPEEVLLLPRRGASSGTDAIEVIDRGEVVGTVPRSLVPSMLVALAGTAGGPETGSTGLVVKTFHRQGQMVGCELLAVADGYGIEISS
jgi:hypothetical protein